MPELLGLPVLLHEVAQAAGTIGDVVLADFGQYVVTAKTAEARSVHAYFDYDARVASFFVLPQTR